MKREMNTFILSIPSDIKKIGEKLNIKAFICNKTWEVFNDNGIRLLYIFNRDGSLIITANGEVEQASWQYIKANRSIVLNTRDGAIMVNPSYYDNFLIVLQKDGTDDCLILLNTNEKAINRSLESINNYLNNKVREINDKTKKDNRNLSDNSDNGEEVFGVSEYNCSYKKLTDFDISDNTRIVRLDCSNNLLSTLDVSNNKALVELDCSNNHLSTLDVSKNTVLVDLDCSNNRLSCLDISNNTELSWLKCSNNQLSCLDVSRNLLLDVLFCKGNPGLTIYVKRGQVINDFRKDEDAVIVFK